MKLISSPPGQNGRRFADNIFRFIFVNKKMSILVKISLKFVPKGPIDNKPGPCITNVFVTRRKNFSQWHRSFQRKLRSHWLKFLRQGPALVEIMSWCWIGDNHCLNQCWPDSLMHIFDIRGRWVNTLIPASNHYHINSCQTVSCQSIWESFLNLCLGYGLSHWEKLLHK